MDDNKQSLELTELADSLFDAKERKKELESQVKAVTAEIEELDRKLSDAMAESEVDKFSHSGKTFYLNTRLFASAQQGRKDELFAALKQNGFGDIVTETVNANTLASFCKEQMAENGEVLPDWLSDVVTTFEKVSVGIRRS